MDEFLKCPWCGDEIAVDAARQAKQVDCPACGKIIDIRHTEKTGPAIPSCSRKSKLRDGTVVTRIGSCSGTKEAAGHVEALFAAHGMWAGTEGSKAYAIFVREADARQAKELLGSDPHKERFHITIYFD